MHVPPAIPSRFVRLLVSCSLIGAVAGCGGVATEPASTTDGTTTGATTATRTVPTTTEPVGERLVTLYFMNDDATALVRVQRPGPDVPARVTAALRLLVGEEPPTGALRPFPAGTRIVSVAMSGTEARVELSPEFESAYPRGGAAAEAAILAPIVYTVTEIPGASSVRFLVSGAAPEPVGSQYDWSSAFRRADFPDLQVVDG